MKKIIQISTVMDHIGSSRTLVVALTENGTLFFKDLQDDGHNWECIPMECYLCDKQIEGDNIHINDENYYLCLDCLKNYNHDKEEL